MYGVRAERGGDREAGAEQEAEEVWRGASFLTRTDDHWLRGRMLENKRERLKTFLRKIDEKAIVRIKHFMRER